MSTFFPSIEVGTSRNLGGPCGPRRHCCGLIAGMELPGVSPEEAERRWSSQFHFRSLTAQLAGWIRRLAAQRSTGTQSTGART